MLLATRCPACGRTGAAPCRRCVAGMRPSAPVPVPEGLDGCVALLDYDGPAREVVARIKYRNHRTSIAWLAAGMAALVPGGFDVVTWAPTTVERRRSRGFDHAELLARAVARETGTSCRALLERVGSAHQTGLALADRQHGPAFRPTRWVHGAQVLLIDDVVTTGATFAAAGGALRAAGAQVVVGLAAAHTM